MADVRLDVRLDASHRQKLEAIAAVHGQPLSAAVRDLIDRAYQEVRRGQKLQAVRQIAEANIEAVPRPDVLAKELDDTYTLPDLY
jgi:hypothetical protein